MVPFPPQTYDDPNTSKPDGTFCVAGMPPGNYFLAAEDHDYGHSTRFVGFFPGVINRANAAQVVVEAGKSISGLQLTVQKEPLYALTVRVVTADGRPAPTKYLGVEITSVDPDPLSFHSENRFQNNGSSAFRFIPSGHYIVASYFRPDFDREPPRLPNEASLWQPAKKEVEMVGDSTVVLTLTPAK